MGTVTKTIRIDEEFLSIIEDYNKLVKEMFGVAPTVSGVLTNTVVKGFEDNLQFFKILNSSMFVSAEPGPGEKLTDELKEKAKALVEKYEQYEIEFSQRGDE